MLIFSSYRLMNKAVKYYEYENKISSLHSYLRRKTNLQFFFSSVTITERERERQGVKNGREYDSII